MARCVPAPACQRALDEASYLWPHRNKATDGICGDAAHQARQSDHNPDYRGYAHAWDLTHDPAHGVDCGRLSEIVKNDSRITYVIFNRRIWSRRFLRWAWRYYSGVNPHTSHMHVSIKTTTTFNISAWFVPPLPPEDDDLRPDERIWLAELHQVMVQGKTSQAKGAMWGTMYHHITQTGSDTLRGFLSSTDKKLRTFITNKLKSR